MNIEWVMHAKKSESSFSLFIRINRYDEIMISGFFFLGTIMKNTFSMLIMWILPLISIIFIR
jgi:hypothetical protein